jgi:hypothetical protein
MPDFSQEDLDWLCRGPQERLAEALATGSPAEVLATFRHMAGQIRGIADLYVRWSVATLGWLHERHGLAAAGDAAMFTELWPAGQAPQLDAGQLRIIRWLLRGRDDALDQRVLEAAAGGSHTEVVALWSRVHEACDTAEQLRRDAVTAQLTLVSDCYGAEGLEECLRHAVDLIWIPRMEADLACAPADRVRSWAEKMSIGHNGAVRITEHTDRWVFTLDPCGSCGRQVLSGRYAPPWNFGLVPAGARAGFLRDDITVYQAHLAVAHGLVPIERTGAPWPAISCAGLAGRPCELVIFRDPAATYDSYYEQVGMRRGEA